MLVDVWVYTPFIMILLLAGLRSLPHAAFEAAALDGVPRRFVFFRITLPMLTPYIITAALFRLLDSIQQFDIIYSMTQGGPGNTLLVFQVRAYLEFYQYTNVAQIGGAAGDPVGDHLRAVERFHQAMAEAARTRARTGVREAHGAHLASGEDRSRRADRADPDLLPVPDLLDLPDVVPDERGHSAHSAEPVLHADAQQLSGADHRQARLGGGHARHRLHAQSLEQRAALDASRWSSRCILGVPAAYAFARFKFRLGEDIAFTLLSFRFAPPLLVLLPLSLYFQEIGLTDTYVGLIWVYQLIALPLILWIVRGYFEDISPDIEYAYRIAGHSWWRTFTRIAVPLAGPGIAAAGLLAFIFCWNNFVFALILASADKQPVTVGALAFVTASGIQYGQIAAAIVLSVTPTLAIALYAQRYLVEGSVSRRGEGLNRWRRSSSRIVSKAFKTGTVLERRFAQRRTTARSSWCSARRAPARQCCCGSSPASRSRTRGAILLQGRDVADAPPETRGIGMAFQNFALFPHMSAYDNIASALTARGASAATIKSEGR